MGLCAVYVPRWAAAKPAASPAPRKQRKPMRPPKPPEGAYCPGCTGVIWEPGVRERHDDGWPVRAAESAVADAADQLRSLLRRCSDG